jgi:hypothetical protein
MSDDFNRAVFDRAPSILQKPLQIVFYRESKTFDDNQHRI